MSATAVPTRLAYVNWTNADHEYSRPYRPGNRLVRGWSGDIEIDPSIPLPEALHAAAELVFKRHNRPDRPDGDLCPSMSVGDVVMFGETALSVDARGFVLVQIDPADLIADRPWTEVW